MKNSTRGLVTIEGITVDEAFVFWVTSKLDDSLVLKSTEKERNERGQRKEETREGKREKLSEERKGISLERARELTTTHGECMQHGNPEGEQFYLFHQEHIPSLAPSISNSILGSPSQATAILPLACLLIYT